MTQPRILITDDQPDVLAALRLLLKSEGFACATFGSPAEGLEAVRRERFDAALIDLNYTRDTTSGQEGLELLANLRKLEPELPVVVTAWGTIDIAVQAMRAGAGDFIEKPWDNRRLVSVLRTQVELGRSREREKKLETENSLLRGKEQNQAPFISDIGRHSTVTPSSSSSCRPAPTSSSQLIQVSFTAVPGVISSTRSISAPCWP